MKETLSELWKNNSSANADEQEQQLLGYIERHFTSLQGSLDEKGRETLQKLVDCYDELLLRDCEQAFIQGFSLATKILIESVT
jgi:hypothetical protein